MAVHGSRSRGSPDAVSVRHLELDAGPRRKASTESRQALEALCAAYWYLLYAFVRRQGFDADEARGLRAPGTEVR